MRSAKIFLYSDWAGDLYEDENGYHFIYREEYLSNPDAEEISLTFPLQKNAFHSQVLFPFFDGLIPEGWLLKIATPYENRLSGTDPS